MRVPLGYGQITALAGAKTLANVTGGIPSGSGSILMQATTQDIRWRDDGTDPTATVGMVLKAGENPTEYHGDLNAITFIAATAGAILNVSFYKS